MDDGSRMYLGLALGILFIIIKGFITACEAVVTDVNHSKIKHQSETDKKAKNLLDIISQPNKLLVSISVIKALTTVAVAISATIAFYPSFKNQLQWISDNSFVVSFISVVLMLFIATLVLVVFGDSIPKKLAQKNSDSFALNISSPLKGLIILNSPFTKVISFFTFIFGKLLGFSINLNKEAVTEEEILLMVDAVNETGGIEESQKEMINNIFEFDDLDISDVMTHRTDIIAVEKNTEIKDVTLTAIEEGFSRIPVYDNNIDNIIGAIYVKDLLRFIISQNVEGKKASEFMREIMYVPQTNHCGELLKEFTETKVQIAVAVDEYGGTAGLVSMEDLLEAIVGNIQDEYDDEVEDIVKISENEYEISGTADPDVVLEEFGLTLPQEHDYDTIGGFVIDLLGYIPNKDESPSVEYENITLTVLSIDDKRIEKLKAIINIKDENILE